MNLKTPLRLIHYLKEHEWPQLVTQTPLNHLVYNTKTKSARNTKEKKTLDSGLSRENSVFAIFSIFFLRQYYDDDAFEYQNNDGIT